MTAFDELPAAVDPAANPHLRGLFEPQRAEVDAERLVVEGELPAALRGSYLRNGPNMRFDPIGSYLYPIDGDAMVHRIELDGGAAHYRNAFVRTPALVAEESAGRALWPGIMTPYRPGPELVGDALAYSDRDLPDINVVRHGGRLLALAESAPPFRLDPADLRTVCKETFDGRLPAGLTAHPKVDPATGEMFSFCYSFEPPYLTWTAIGRDGVPTRAATPVDGLDAPVMIHDMALTATYLVVPVCPLVFDIAAAMTGGSVLQWRPEAGARIALIPRDGSPVRWCSDEAFWMWHTANAYDAGDGTVVLDYVQWDHPGIVTGAEEPTASTLVRAVLDPATGLMTRTEVARAGMEFPRIDDRLIGRPHRQVATVGESPGADLVGGDADLLRWYDLDTGAGVSWGDEALSFGEPVHLPTEDGEHYWGAIVTERRDRTGWFYVFDGEEPAAGPRARVRLPHRVPAGLHGAWLPGE
ncbi:carotenoid oxygenase family protein [Tomitella fengzijianii]|uniref:Dioxygenase n=1 Tax=Tomitella fengzijianii TaxID=2597660 RepID=A0A516X690_9ACTN|nr:carotenoid oxygenase family protein [Tomitella fengzijianii]QDQ98523.1 carotenoid oxygenase family protein [Tomitella fengzijianii]